MTFVDVGQKVWALFRERRMWIYCRVEASHGDTARIMNSRYGVDTWFHVSDLKSKPELMR